MMGKWRQGLVDVMSSQDSDGDWLRRGAGAVIQVALVFTMLIGVSEFMEFATNGQGAWTRFALAVVLGCLFAALHRFALNRQARSLAAWASVALVALELCLLATTFPWLLTLGMAVVPTALWATAGKVVDDNVLTAGMLLLFVISGVKGWARFLHRDATARAADEQARLYERMAMEDALTGLPNRRSFERTMAARLGAPGGAPVHLAMIDVDRFKAINDTWSHDLGDRVLQQIARSLGASVGRRGVVARLAGDEFVVALFDLDDEGAEGVARAAAQAVAAHDWPALQAGLAVTISVGLATAAPGESLGELLRRGDARMYADKRRGAAR